MSSSDAVLLWLNFPSRLSFLQHNFSLLVYANLNIIVGRRNRCLVAAKREFGYITAGAEFCIGNSIILFYVVQWILKLEG